MRILEFVLAVKKQYGEDGGDTYLWSGGSGAFFDVHIAPTRRRRQRRRRRYEILLTATANNTYVRGPVY